MQVYASWIACLRMIEERKSFDNLAFQIDEQKCFVLRFILIIIMLQKLNSESRSRCENIYWCIVKEIAAPHRDRDTSFVKAQPSDSLYER